MLAERSETIGEATNNVAEYRALLLGIELAKELGADEAEFIADSKLIVEQVRGNWKVKQEHLRPLHTKVRDDLRDLGKWSIRHVKRDDNARVTISTHLREKFRAQAKKLLHRLLNALMSRPPNFARACGRVPVGGHPDKRPDSRPE